MTAGLLINNGKALTYGPTLLLGIAGGQGGGGGNTGITVSASLGIGQSNANYADNVDGALAAKVKAIAFYLGATTYSAYSNSQTDLSGCGSYPPSSGTGYSYYLNYNGADTPSAAASATADSNGTNALSYISGLSSGARSSIYEINCYWLETDSVFISESSKATVEAGLLNWFAQVRAAVGKTAAQLPVIFFAPPYETTTAAAACREVMAELAATPANNVVWASQQTYDTISRNESWNATTGVASGGNTDGGHRSAIDNVALYKRAALAAARAILSSNSINPNDIPSALGNGIGPQIASASLSGTALTVNIAHDGGNDLIIPLLASQGVGWALMDGGSINSPGNIIKATACTYVNSTTLLVTLASAPSNAHTSCRLFYPWPGTLYSVQPDTEIGRGCAVTDNWASVAKPTNFDMNAAYGSGWQANQPICFPVSLSGTTATAGIALSS